MIHIQSFSPLYEAVQSSGIFPDSKFFPDCTPRFDAATTLERYAEAQQQPDFDLSEFVKAHFDYPETPETGYETRSSNIHEHLNGLWNVLTRQPSENDEGTLLPLPNPYIVPGGRFREIYYWDSYFTMLGLKASGRTDIIRDMVDNFAALIDQYGHIPNGNRSYYLSRSQPPFFALMVQLLADIEGGDDTLLHYRPQLEREYAFWMQGQMKLDQDGEHVHRRTALLPDGSILNRYYDDSPEPRPEAWTEDMHTAETSGRNAAEVWLNLRAAAESGWDFSSRWLDDSLQLSSIRTTELLPVDLNCLLYFLEKTLLRIHRHMPDRTPADVLKMRARQRKNAILHYCWDGNEGFFFDYDHVHQVHSPHWTLAAVFPLFFQMATPEQAQRVAAHIEQKFLKSGGVVTTPVNTGQQWDAPNGWAPLQWMTIQGLRHYGHETLAATISERWLNLNEKTFAATGKMMEKYNVEQPDAPGGGGEYPNQDGFGWTNGVFLALSK